MNTADRLTLSQILLANTVVTGLYAGYGYTPALGIRLIIYIACQMISNGVGRGGSDLFAGGGGCGNLP